MTKQMQAATIRAFYGGVLSAALVFFVGLQVSIRTVDTVEDAAIAAAVAFVSYVISRGVAEGLIDSNRGPTAADVGQPQ
jgi:hypothetical protein